MVGRIRRVKMANVPVVKESLTVLEQRQVVVALEMAATSLERQANRLTIPAAAKAVKDSAQEFRNIAVKLS